MTLDLESRSALWVVGSVNATAVSTFWLHVDALESSLVGAFGAWVVGSGVFFGADRALGREGTSSASMLQTLTIDALPDSILRSVSLKTAPLTHALKIPFGEDSICGFL